MIEELHFNQTNRIGLAKGARSSAKYAQFDKLRTLVVGCVSMTARLFGQRSIGVKGCDETQ